MERYDLVFASFDEELEADELCRQCGISVLSFCVIARAIRAEPEPMARAVMAAELLGKRGLDLLPAIMRSRETTWLGRLTAKVPGVIEARAFRAAGI